MAERTFKLHYPQNTLIDPMGSIIINVNTTANPQFEWAYINSLNGVGPVDPSKEVNISLLGFKDTTSYKIRYLENITRHNNTLLTVGSAACLTSPDAVSCQGYGPYIVFGKRYYIDFIVLYFVNRSVVPQGGNEADYYLSSPIFSVDTSRCTPDYGIFIASPKPKTPTNNSDPYIEATAGTGDRKMFATLPSYTNELGFFNQNIKYRITALKSANSNDYMDDVILTPGNIVQALQNTINYGQTSIVSVKDDNTPIVLRPQASNTSSFNPQSFLPFILFRYISVDAPTRRVFLSFSFAPNA